MSMRLSKNFTLNEFLLSQTAERNGIDMTPTPLVLHNIKTLVETVLQPLSDIVNVPIYISSGYRPHELNSLIGGSLTSAHKTGSAADFTVSGMSPFDVCELIVRQRLPYDQLIHEFGKWVHVGIADNLRRENLTAYLRDGRTRYQFGIRRIDELGLFA